MGRSFGDYSTFHYEQWEKPVSTKKSNNPLENISHPEIELGELIDEYTVEATNKLIEILDSMKKQWPIT